MLSIQHLTTGYGKKQVLDNISFEVGNGNLVLLTGGNGSGKSTILKAIYGLLSPWKNNDGVTGRIIFDGKDITNIRTSDLLKLGVVYMPQKKNVFEEFTVEENLLTAASIYKKNEARKKISSVFADLPLLAKLKKRTPFSMSGGEKQLLAFGSILLHSPKLMLLDEPFAGMDATNTLYFLSKIIQLNKQGITFLIVEHKNHLFNCAQYREIQLELGIIKL